MLKVFKGFILLGLISHISCQQLLVCQVTSSDICIFLYKTVQKGEKIVVGVDHGSITNADIKQVIFQSSSIYAVPPELFATFKNLEKLTMVAQGVQEIQPNTFTFADKLKELNIRNNSLKILTERTFDGAYNLRELLFGFNEISSVHKNSFKKLVKLDRIELGYNRLRTFDPSTLDNLLDFTQISLMGNQLTTLHKTTFKNNLKMEIIQLGVNNFNSLSNIMFSHLTRLKNLYLHGKNCINKDYMESASSQMATIENDLLKCAIGYLSLENDELQESNNNLYNMVSKLMSDVSDIKNSNVVCRA